MCFEDERRTTQQQDCVSVIMDLGIPYCERHDTYMVERHQQVYDLIAQCDSEDRPIQVIAALGESISEHKKDVKIFVTVKNYNDSIFPSIWGVLKNNLTANAFVNVIQDYFIGTSDSGNGTIRTINNS